MSFLPAETDDLDRHVAEGQLVLTVIGNDGVRWACQTCNETVYQRGEDWLHFDKSRDPIPSAQTPSGGDA